MDRPPPRPAEEDNDRLSKIPNELLIKVIHVDDSICVIVKPANLRSVPGHAQPPPPDDVAAPSSSPHKSDTSKQRSSSRRSPQSCWISAVKSFVEHGKPIVEPSWSITAKTTATRHNSEWDETLVLEALSRLANSKTVDSVPRKWKSFLRHVHRYQKTIIPPSFNKTKSTMITPLFLESLARQMFHLLEQRYQPLLQLPEPSPHEDSAMGQLILMGYGSTVAGSRQRAPAPSSSSSSSVNERQLYAVHRLDCETSGVMVFARKEQAASFLSHAWRREEGQVVSKIYWAKVKTWPPFQQDHQRKGRIDLPLAASTTERLKWQVQTNGGGKPSTTLWRVLSQEDETNKMSQGPQHVIDDTRAVDNNSASSCSPSSSSEHILLELTPLTGRTHQLRIHCAHLGSGIVGDSLYGTNPVAWTSSSGNNQLCLHAYHLCFPHPDTGEQVQFTAPPNWLT